MRNVQKVVVDEDVIQGESKPYLVYGQDEARLAPVEERRTGIGPLDSRRISPTRVGDALRGAPSLLRVVAATLELHPALVDSDRSLESRTRLPKDACLYFLPPCTAPCRASIRLPRSGDTPT